MKLEDVMEERLEGLGLSKAEFAGICGVKPSAVSNWISRGKWPVEAEGHLLRLEGVGEEFSLEDRVIASGGLGVIIRIDRHKTRAGEFETYWVRSYGKDEQGKEVESGPSTRYPGKYLRHERVERDR